MLKTYTYPKFDYCTPPEIASGQTRKVPVVVVGSGAAALTVASAEGTVVMCRTLRSAKPLDDVQAELR